jgi:hypothetical protein
MYNILATEYYYTLYGKKQTEENTQIKLRKCGRDL